MSSKRNKYHSTQKKYNTRLFLLSAVLGTLVIILIGWLYSIQIKQHNIFIQEAKAVQETKKDIQPKRGIIYFQDKEANLVPVAINKNYKLIYAVPETIQKENKIADTAKTLATLLNLDYNNLVTKLSKKNDLYEVIAQKIDDEEKVKQIQSLNLKGIYISEENSRYYPLNDLGCHIIGFVGETKQSEGKKEGLYGLEKYYNDVLEGKKGVFYGVRDARGRLVRSLFSNEEVVADGSSLVTTIDKNIQYKIEEELANLIETRQGVSGSIIVMEARTGKILGLANWPKYNLNNYSQVKDYSVFKNLAIEDAVEIGSVMKILTMAAGLDSHAITPQTTYIDKGYVTIDKKTIKNFRNEVYGEATMTKVLEKSINTGAVFAEQQTGHKIFLDYLKKFRMDELTGIDLPFEARGDLSNLERKDTRDIYFATASFGHGILVTPIALLRAYSTVANGGVLVNPYVTEAVISPGGKREETPKDETNERIISEETAKALTDMMVKVVEEGYGSRAKIKGYLFAGKTGTANIASFGGYSEDTIQSFVGFFPAYNPRFAILVKLDKPKIGDAASATVTLSFRNVAQFLINYYNIPPDEFTASKAS